VCSYSALHARQISFANDENKFCFTPLRCKDIAFPIEQGMLNICDGSAIIRKDARIETVSVRRFNIGIASSNKKLWHIILFGGGLRQCKSRSGNDYSQND